MLADILFQPYFESLMCGSFVKVVYGSDNTYKLAEVSQVFKGQKAYTINIQAANAKKEEMEQITTNIEIECTYGKSKRKFKLSLVSN